MADTETKSKGKPGRKPKQRSDETARMVESMAQYGLPQDQICAVVGMCKHTLEKLYREELDRGAAVANLKVAKRLYSKAVDEGDTSALIFWAKCRLRWKTDSPEVVTDQSVPTVKIKIEDASAKAKVEAEDAAS